MEERTIDEARGALSGRLAALASRLHQGPLAAAEYCRAFCEVLVENSRTIPGAENSPALLTTYKEAISAFTKILPSLSDDCPQVSAVLARLVLCCFELLLYLPASDLPVGVWDAFTLSIEESQATLEQLGHDELRVVVDVVRAGGAWRTPAMLSILHKESVPPEKVDASLLSEGPVMLRLRLSSLVAVGRHVEACHLAECCANLSELGSASATFKLAHLGLVCDTASSDDDLQSEAAHIDGSEALDLVCNLEAAGHAHGARLLCTALLKRKLRNVEKNSTWEIIMLWSQLTRRAWPSESSRFISACLELGSVALTTCHLLFLIRTIQAEVPSDGLEACVQLCIRGLRLQAEDGCESATEEHVSAMVSLCLTLACLMPDDAEVGRACLLTHFFEDISVVTYRALEQASSNSEAKPTCSSSLPPSMRCELLLLLKARWPFDPELWDWTSLRQQCLNMLPSEETAKLVPAEGDSVKEEQTSPGVEEHEEEEDKEKKDRSGVKMLSDDGRISWREALAATNLMPGYTINAQHQHNQGGTGLAALKQDMQKSLIDRPQIPSLRTKHRCRLCRRDVGSVRIVRHARKHFVTGQPGCPLCPKRFSNIEEATWHVRLHLRRARKAAMSRTAHEKQTKSSRMIHRLVERPRKNPQDKDWTPALAVPLHRESDASSESEPSSSSGSPQLARPSLHRKVKKNQLYGSDFVTFSDDGTSDVDDSSDAFFPHNGSRRERINGTNLTATEVLVDYFGPTIGCDGYLRRHPCPSLQCDKAFKMFKTLVAHVRTVHAMNANVQLAMDALQAGRRRCCRYCRRKFGSTVHLHDHLFISHSGPAPYGCPQMDCSLRFESNEELVRHSASHLKYCGQCAFPGCGEIFGRKQLLYRHEASHYEVHVPGETSEGTETSSPPSPQRPRGRPSLRGHPPSTRGRMRSLTNTTRTPKTSTVQMRTSLKLQKPLKKLFCGIDSCFSTFNWPQSLHRHLETMHGRQGLPLVRSRHIVPEELRGLPTSSLSHSIMDSIKNPPKPTLPAQNADISTILKNPSPHIERSESQRQPRGRRGRGRGRPNKVREPTTGCKHDWEAQWPAIMQDGKFVCTHCSMVYESGKPLGGRITTKRKAEGPLEHLCLTKNKPSKTPIFVKSIKREKGASLPYALQNTTSSGDTKVDITANRPKVEIVERIEDKAGDTTPEIRHASDERIVGDCVAPFSKEKVTLEIDEAIKEPDKTPSRACVERSFINDVPQVPFSQPILPCQRFETKPFTKMLAFDTPSQHSTQLDQPEWKCSSSSGSYGPHRDTNTHTTHIPTTEPYHASLNTNTEPPPHPYEPNFGKPVQTLFPSSEPPITSYDGLGSNLNHPAQSPHVVSTQDPPRSSSYPYCAPSYSNSVTNTHLPLQSVSFQYQQSQSMQKATDNNSDSCNKDPSNSIHTKCTASGTLPLSYPNESLAEHSSSFAADLQADGTSCESNIFGEISVSEILETVRQMDLENSEAHGEDDDRDGVDWTSSDNPYNSLYWGTGSDSNDDSHCNLGMDDLFGAFSEAHEDASGTDSKYNEDTSTPRKRKSARHRKRATDVNMKVLIRPFICHLEGCKYNALTRSALVNHYMKTHGYSREGVGNLNHCKSSFTPFHCFLSPCTKAFTRNSNLRSHYRSVHRITGEELDKLCSESLKSIATNLSSPIKQEVISHVSCAVKQESPTRNLPAYGQKDLGELTSEDTSQTSTQLLPSSFCMIGRQSGPVDQVAPSVATDTDCKGQIHPPSHPSFSSQISSLSPFGNQDDLANPNLPDSVQSELSKVRLQAAGKSSEAECSTSCEIPPALNAECRAQMMQVMQKGKMPATSIKLENDDVSQLNGNTCDKATRSYTCNMTKCRKYFENFTKLIDHYRDYHNLSSDEVQHYIAPDDADEFREHLNSLGSFTCYSNLSRHEHAEGFGSVESPQKQSPPGFQVISNAAACLSGESSVPQPVENSFTPMPTPEDNSNVPSPATIFAEPAVKNDLSKPVQTGLRGALPCLGAAVNSKNKRLTKKNKGWPAHLSKASTAEQPTSQTMKYLCGMENCTGAFHTSATLRRHMRRKHDHAVAKTHPKPIIQLVRGESGEWIDLCNGTKVIDGNTEVDELPPSILKSSEDTLEICKCSHLNSKHACMLISCSGVLSSSYSLIRHYRRVHRMPAAYIDMHLSRLVINRQRSDQKRHRASADASPSSAKPVDRDRVQNWRRNYDFKVGSKMNRNHAHASSVDCNPAFNSLLNPDPTLASHFDLGIIPDSPLHQGTAPASTLETEAASAYPLKPEDARTSTLHPGAVPTSTLHPGAVAVSTLNPSLTPTSTLEPGVVPTSEFEPNIAPTSTFEPGIASTSMLEPDVVATSVLEKDAAPASTLETDDVPVFPLQQDAAPDSSLENEMALPSLLECRSRQQSTFISHHQHNSMLGNNEKHTSLSRGPALASLLKSNHTFVSPVNKGQELSSSHPLQTLPTSVNHSPKYSNTNQLPHDHNCSLATTMVPSQSSPSHLCHGQALARHLCPGRASAGQMGRGRGSAGQMGRGSAGHMGRGRGSAGQMGRGRGSAGQSGRGRGSAGQIGRGRGSAGQIGRGRGSAGQSGRGRGSAGQSGRGRGSAGQIGRGRGSAGHTGRGRASADQLCRGRASAGQLPISRSSTGQFCRSSPNPSQVCRGRTSPNQVHCSHPSPSQLFRGFSPSKVFRAHSKSSPTCASTEVGLSSPVPDSSALSNHDDIHSASFHRITATSIPPGITCSPSPPPSSDPSLSTIPARNPSLSALMSSDASPLSSQGSDTSPSAPLGSEPSLLVTPDSDPPQWAPLGSDSSTSARPSVDSSSLAPLGNACLSAATGSSPSSVPLGSNNDLSAPPGSDLSLSALPGSDHDPLDSDSSPSVLPWSEPSRLAPPASDLSWSIPQGSDCSHLTPPCSNPFPSAPPGSDPFPSTPPGSDPFPSTPPSSDPFPSTPPGSDPFPSAPGSDPFPSAPGSDPFPSAPPGSDPFPSAPPGSDPSVSTTPASYPSMLAPFSSDPSPSPLPRSCPSLSATEGSDHSPSALLRSNPALALLDSCSSLSVPVGSCLSPFGLPCNTNSLSAPAIITTSPSAASTNCSPSTPLSIAHTPSTPLGVTCSPSVPLIIARSPSAPPSIDYSPLAPPSNIHSTVAPLSSTHYPLIPPRSTCSPSAPLRSVLSPSAPSYSDRLPLVSMCSALSPSIPLRNVHYLSAPPHGARSLSAPPCSSPSQRTLHNAWSLSAPPLSTPNPLTSLHCASLARFPSAAPSSTQSPSVPPPSTRSLSAPPSIARSMSATSSSARSPSAPPSSALSLSAPPSSTSSPSASPSSAFSHLAPQGLGQAHTAPSCHSRTPAAASCRHASTAMSRNPTASAASLRVLTPSAACRGHTQSAVLCRGHVSSASSCNSRAPFAASLRSQSPSVPSFRGSVPFAASCRGHRASLPTCHSMAPPPTSGRSLSPSGTSCRGHTPSAASFRGHAPSHSSNHSHAQSAPSYHTHANIASSNHGQSPSAFSCRRHMPSASPCRGHSHSASSCRGHSRCVSSCRGHSPSASSCRGQSPSPSSCRGRSPSASSFRGRSSSASSCRGRSPSASSCRGRLPSASSCRGQSPSASSCRGQSPSASSCRGQSPSASSCRRQSPSASSCRGQSPSASSCRGQSPSASSCRGQSPSASSCRRQSPAASSCRGQSPAASSCRGQSPAASSYRGQSPSASSCRGQSPSASSCRGQSPSASSCRGQSHSASSCRGHSPSASSCRGQSPSASSCRGQSPSASACPGPSPSASSFRGPSPSASSCRRPSPSASSCHGPSPSASSCHRHLPSASLGRGHAPSPASCRIPTHSAASYSKHTSSPAAPCCVPSPSVTSFRSQVPSASSCHGLTVSPPLCTTSSPSALSSRIHTTMVPPTSPFRIPAPPILPNRGQSFPTSSCTNRFPLPVLCHSHNPANSLSREGSLVCPLKNCRVRTCPWSNHRVLPSSLGGSHASSALLNCNAPMYSQNHTHFSPSGPDPAQTSPSGPDPARTSPSGPDPAWASPSGPDPTWASPSGPDPARESPSSPDPARASPSNPDPARASPSGPDPARASPSGPDPARPSPSGPDPARPSQSGPESARPSPSGPDPSRASPSGPDPSRASPSGPDPARASPSGPDPARAPPSGPDPARAPPSGPDPARAPPSGPDPARASPSGPDPARASPSGPDPARASPSGPDPARASPSGPDRARASPSGPDHARASPSGPDHARASPSGPDRARASPSGPDRARASPSGPDRARASPSGPDRARASPSGPDRARASPSRPDRARASPSGPDPARASPSRPDPARASPSRPDPARASPSRPDPARASPSRPDPARASPSGPDPARASPSGPDPARPLPLVHVPTHTSQLIHHHMHLSNGFDRTRFSRNASSSRKLSHSPRKRGRPRKTDVFESHHKLLVSDTSNVSQPCRYEASFIDFLRGSYLARRSLSPSKWTPHPLRARSKGRRMSGRRVGHLALKSFANAISHQEEEAVIIQGVVVDRGMNLRVVLERKLLDRKVHQLLALKPVVVLERLVLTSQQ